MSLLKNGWHPAGDKEIHRSTWKKDLKNMASRKDTDAERAKNHVAAPLSTLKDPDSFGAPPKHSAYYPNAQPATRALPSSGSNSTRSASPGLGAATPLRPEAKVNRQQEQEERPPAQPYSVNRTGLRTDNLPLPPGRREVPQTPTAARPVPSLPPRTTTGPPPILPPRQSENPSEHDPPPPPTYGEAVQSPAVQAAAINRLGQAGISVPGFGINSSSSASTHGAASSQGHSGQLSELQQRFARMNNGSDAAATPVASSRGQGAALNASSLPSWKQAQQAHAAITATTSTGTGLQDVAALASQKKKPPPPPVKKAGAGDSEAPPPIPMSSKPKPG